MVMTNIGNFISISKIQKWFEYIQNTLKSILFIVKLPLLIIIVSNKNQSKVCIPLNKISSLKIKINNKCIKYNNIILINIYWAIRIFIEWILAIAISCISPILSILAFICWFFYFVLMFFQAFYLINESYEAFIPFSSS